MKEAAARAIASVIPEEELNADYVLPDPFNPLIVERIVEAVMAEAEKAKREIVFYNRDIKKRKPCIRRILSRRCARLPFVWEFTD